MFFININNYVGEKKRKGQLAFIIFILALAILYTSGFSYVNWNSTYGGWTQNVVAILFMLFLFINWPKNKKYHFRVDALMLIFIPFISMLNTHTLYGQGYVDSIKTLSGCFVWVFYFFLHKYKVQESTILKAILAIALFVIAVQVIQQFTYPNALFGIYNEDTMYEEGLKEAAEQRNGLWRFRISNAYETCIILFASVVWIRKRFNSKLLILMGLMLVSVYLTLTRQIMAACFLTLFFSFFLGKKNKGYMQAILIGVVVAALLYSYSDVLFGSLAEQTTDDMSDNYIRVLAGTYFWNESISDPYLFLFGHGLPGQTGTFRMLMQQLNQMMGFYTVDVGFIGMTYTFGAIYVVVCFRLLWKLLVTYRKYTPVYIRLFVIFTGVMSIMIFPIQSTFHYLIWTMLMYITDLHINRGKDEEKAVQPEIKLN
jgi:hypothetical protein